MISDSKNRGNEVKLIVNRDIYQVRRYADNYFHSILDIGANLGIFSVFMRMRHPDATIVAVEPCMETCQYLRQNINMLNIHVQEKAFGNGQPYYFTPRAEAHMLNNMFLPKQEQTTSYKVGSITLKELCDEYKIRKPYALKFNCEGGEEFLLEDPWAAAILQAADLIAIQIHFQTEYNQTYSKYWLKKEEYDDHFQNLLSSTHFIQCHHINSSGKAYYEMNKKKH